MEGGFSIWFVGEFVQRNKGEGFLGGGGGRGRNLDINGIVAEEMMLEGFLVDEVLLRAEEVGREEDVGAEGRE